MLFFASGQGRLTVVPAQINQNSNGANTIYLTGAFPSASVVTVAFTLPDGTNTEPQLMTGDKTVDYNGLTLAVKECSLPKSITQVYGRVTAQFYIQNGSEILATEATNITVAKGVPSESPSAPENIYEQIVAALSSIQTELTNKLDKQSGSTSYDMVYSKLESGAQEMKPTSPYIKPSHIVERDEIAGVHVPYATLPEHAVPLKQFAEKLAADIAEAIATKLDIAGGTITGDLDVDGDLVVSGDFTAKGKTFIEKATTLAVKNAIIETNAGKTDLKTLLSGLVINKNPTTAYGFVYDPTDDTVKFGQGSVDENGVFTFKTGEGAPIATRADSSTFTAEHLVKWDNAKKRFVDAGKSISEVGKTPKSIDAVNGAFTAVNYDTTDGITLESNAKIINTDDSEYTATLLQEIPIKGGDNITIDKASGSEFVEIKLDKTQPLILQMPEYKTGFAVDFSDAAILPKDWLEMKIDNYDRIKVVCPAGTASVVFPTNDSGTSPTNELAYYVLTHRNVKTLFGDKSIYGSGTIDLYRHNIVFTGSGSTEALSSKIYVSVISSNNLNVDSLTDLKTLLGNSFNVMANGYDYNSTAIVVAIDQTGYWGRLGDGIMHYTYPAGTWTDEVTTV